MEKNPEFNAKRQKTVEKEELTSSEEDTTNECYACGVDTSMLLFCNLHTSQRLFCEDCLSKCDKCDNRGCMDHMNLHVCDCKYCKHEDELLCDECAEGSE